MRSWSRALLLAVLAGCGPAIPEPRDPNEPPEMTPQHEVLIEKLRDPAIEVILYRPVGLSGYWIWDEKNQIDRPGPSVPRKTMKVEDREALAKLANGGNLLVKEDDFSKHAYLIEFVKDGKPIARADAHMDGRPATLFFICKNEGRIPTGTVQFTFTDSGEWKWEKALDEIWGLRKK